MWQCPQIRPQYGMKNKAAIALQCKSNVKLIAAFVLYSIKKSCLRRFPHVYWFYVFVISGGMYAIVRLHGFVSMYDRSFYPLNF